jgi:branched-chain amino acid aminotransferase
MWDVGTKSNLSEDVQMYSLALSKWRKAPKNVLPASIKGAGAYTMNIVAKHEAEARGYDDAILLDIDGNVAEVTTSNIFIVKDSVLITPPPVNVLNGITRLTVLDISKEMNIKIEEKFFDLEYMQAADEVFLTGTSIEIMPVCRVENTIFQLGDITKLIIKKYHEVIYS